MKGGHHNRQQGNSEHQKDMLKNSQPSNLKKNRKEMDGFLDVYDLPKLKIK